MPTTKDRLGVAVIGAGMAGRAHAAGYAAARAVEGPALPPVDLVAIADVDAGLGSAAARRFGYARAETSWEAVAAAADVDVVSVVVANHLHRPVVEGLLAAGKHVLCEKPMAPTVADAEAMVAAAEAAAAERGAETAVGFTFRRSPPISGIRDLVGHRSEPGIGETLHFNGHYWCDYGVDPKRPMSWRYRGAPGSGALADIGSHLTDLAEFVGGPIAAVRGAVLATVIRERALPLGTAIGHAATELSDTWEPVENDDVATFTATFESGAAGTFSVSRVAYGHPNALGFEVFASGGAATFDLERAGEFRVADGSSPPGTAGYRTVLAGPQHPYLSGGLAMDFPGVGYGQNDLFVWQARAFLEQVAGVTGGLPRTAGFADGLRNLRLLAAVAESAANGGAEVVIDQAGGRAVDQGRTTP
jgi:predicted dehydrogenase